MIRLVLLAVLSVSSTTVLAQAQNVVVHQHAPANLIDGRVHPELIPDLTAYRLVLIAISKPPDPTNDQIKHQQAQLSKIGLQELDERGLISILANFNAEYRNLIRTWNEQATAANARGQRADLNYFRLERDQLVQSTHDAIKSNLSANGWARFDAYVQHEKTHMKVSAREVKQ
jgi:hypothetical protein